MSRYPYVDRHPCIIAAGKAGDPFEDGAKTIFHDVTLEEKVDVIRKQFGFIEAKDYSPEWMKSPDRNVSGAFTEIRHSLRPPLPTPFEQLEEEIKCTIYDSYWNRPIGHSRDQTPGLPAGMKPESVTFGKKTVRSIDAGIVINPPKKFEELEEEEKFYHDLYAFSHQNHYPGERIKLGYKPPFDPNKVYGKPSECDERGGQVKQSLTWFNNDPICGVSRRQAAMRERYLPSVGKSLDRTGVTDLFPEDHTYGKPNNKDFYGVEDLLNECPPSLMRRDMLIFLAYANGLRQNVDRKVSTGDITLEELHEEIRSLADKEISADTVNFDCIHKIMKKHGIHLNRSKLEPLLLILGILSEDDKIKVDDFIRIINKNARFPDIKRQNYILPPEYQTCSNKNVEEFSKKNDRILSMPPAGLPTTGLEKLHPVYEYAIVNMDHLSEETTARSLISPSIYTQYGLSHRDFFQPRTKEVLGTLFRKINVTLTDEELDEIYKQGYELDKTGGVCVETFRNILDERAYRAYNRIPF